MYENKERRSEQEPTQHATGNVNHTNERIRRIRARSSYLLFQQLYSYLKTNPDTAGILRKFYDVLDAKGGFGSIRNAEYAKESLDWVPKDKGDK